jgi:hypothetical protein
VSKNNLFATHFPTITSGLSLIKGPIVAEKWEKFDSVFMQKLVATVA